MVSTVVRGNLDEFGMSLRENIRGLAKALERITWCRRSRGQHHAEVALLPVLTINGEPVRPPARVRPPAEVCPRRHHRPNLSRCRGLALDHHA
jgi:hypothetical protein